MRVLLSVPSLLLIIHELVKLFFNFFDSLQVIRMLTVHGILIAHLSLGYDSLGFQPGIAEKDDEKQYKKEIRIRCLGLIYSS